MSDLFELFEGAAEAGQSSVVGAARRLDDTEVREAPADLLDVSGPLRELVDAGIVFPFQYLDQGYFDFRHPLLRDAIYTSVLPRDLRRFHGRAAEFNAELIGETHRIDDAVRLLNGVERCLNTHDASALPRE